MNVTEAIFVSFGLMMFFQIFQGLPKRNFARVIFDVTSSQYLLNQTIRKHVKSYESDMNFVKKVLGYFYVYDFSGGENDFDNALEFNKNLDP